MMMNKYRIFWNSLLLFTAVLFAEGCSSPKVPTEGVTDAMGVPAIFPDYIGIVIPPNIAPLNFEVSTPGDEYVARVSAPDGTEIVASGNPIQWNAGDWHRLLDASKGKELSYELYVRNGDVWSRYRFSNTVAPEDVDPYISYRLIEPGYVQFAGISLCQRDLTSFDESEIFNNACPADERRGQCMNCHVPRNNYKDRASLFHVRKRGGGTVLMAGDSIVKIDLKTDSTISAGVYPAWHPTLDLIAFSNNDTNQRFFEDGDARIEVYDNSSDLILYDMKTHTVNYIANDPDILETFPAWSPDGKKLYYSAARYPEGVTPENLVNYYKYIRYDILSREFDPTTRRFSDPDTVVSASAVDESALLPRISPDGKYLLYCKAPFGTFHIWHKDSDLWMKDLATGEERPLANANSDDTDSYHTWSSNGRWVVFSSRRDDGSYTRPYIAYIDADGHDSKAFIIPQEDPAYHRQLMKSYNVPEFLLSPVKVSRADILRTVSSPANPASFK